MKKILTASAYVLLAACTAYSHKAMEEQEQFVVETPYAETPAIDDTISPDVYALVAARATNRMLDETAEVYEQNPRPTLYLMQIKNTDENLPDGFYLARRETKDIIEGSGTFTLVNNLNEAQYYLEVSVSPIQLKDKEVPAISYHLSLYTNQNAKIGEWAQMIKQVQNDDKSWW